MYIDYFLEKKVVLFMMKRLLLNKFVFRNVAIFGLNLTLNVKSLKDFFFSLNLLALVSGKEIKSLKNGFNLYNMHSNFIFKYIWYCKEPDVTHT